MCGKNRFVRKEELIIGRASREDNLGQCPVVVWFTGLSGAGKTTLANALELKLRNRGVHTYLLDGDNVRLGLCKDLGFSNRDRKENIRRIAEVSRLFFDSATVTLCSFVSPFEDDRAFARGLFPKGSFFEVYMKSTVKECERKDTKGLYKMARKGLLTDFTGVSSPYEEPQNPELVIDSNMLTVSESVDVLYSMIIEKIKKE